MIARIAEKIAAPNDNGCRLWQAHINASGYGLVRYDGGMRLAHRVVYQLMVGPIPEGSELDHLCRVRACVNPEHLEPVTRRENVLRGLAPAARNAQAETCIRGHVFDEQNTAVSQRRDGRVRRRCRACSRDWSRRREVDRPRAYRERVTDNPMPTVGYGGIVYRLRSRKRVAPDLAAMNPTEAANWIAANCYPRGSR